MTSSFLSHGAWLVGQAARAVVHFADSDTRQTVSVRQADGRDEEQYLFNASDDIAGTVCTCPAPAKLPGAWSAQPCGVLSLMQVEVEVAGNRKLEHTGVKVELIGLIGMLHARDAVLHMRYTAAQ